MDAAWPLLPEGSNHQPQSLNYKIAARCAVHINGCSLTRAARGNLYTLKNTARPIKAPTTAAVLQMQMKDKATLPESAANSAKHECLRFSHSKASRTAKHRVKENLPALSTGRIHHGRLTHTSKGCNTSGAVLPSAVQMWILLPSSAAD